MIEESVLQIVRMIVWKIIDGMQAMLSWRKGKTQAVARVSGLFGLIRRAEWRSYWLSIEK